MLAIVVFVTCAVLGYAAVERTVKGFARAPVGCTTTVEFHRAARFTLFVETTGRLASLDGDCDARRSYSRRDDDLPRLDVSVVSDGGGTLALDDTTTDDYDVEGFVGRAFASVEVQQAGTYRVTVAGDADDVAVAIGGDPNVDARWWWLGGVGAAAVVLLLGLVLVVMGLVGRRPAPPPPPVTAFTVGTNLSGYTPAGTLPPAHMPPPPGAGPWTSLPPPPPPPPGAAGVPGPPPAAPPSISPPMPPAAPPTNGVDPDATAAGATSPPPPPPPN